MRRRESKSEKDIQEKRRDQSRNVTEVDDERVAGVADRKVEVGNKSKTMKVSREGWIGAEALGDACRRSTETVLKKLDDERAERKRRREEKGKYRGSGDRRSEEESASSALFRLASAPVIEVGTY